MDVASEFQIAAQTDGEIRQPAFQRTDGQQVCKRLGGMLMPSVPGIDHRDFGTACRNHGRAFFGMAHGTYIRITGDNPYGVGNTFTFGSGRGIRIGKSEYLSAQIQHGRFKTEPCPCARLIKAGGQFFSFAYVSIPVHVLFHIAGQVKQAFQFLDCKIQRTH